MVIRAEQMARFSKAAAVTFEDEVVVHLNKCFPEECRAFGEPKVRETVRYGVERASAYGITAQRDVCKYIDLMFVFGRDFDRDPKLTWPSAVLKDRAMREPTVKLERLYETGKKHDPRVTTHGRF